MRGYDFVGRDSHPDDENGHGTHVAGTIGEGVNNGVGLTGLAYGAKIMPIRVLDSIGEGDVPVIARGVRYAARRGADVINLSLEFSPEVTAGDIPELLSAIRYARSRGAVVVGASGNEGHATVAYPARAGDVLAVGATTERGCLSDFSNEGRGLDIVAPGGGRDAVTPVGEPGCDAALPGRPDRAAHVHERPRRLRLSGHLRGHVDGRAARRRGRRARHRLRRRRTAPDGRGGREAPRGDRARPRHAGLRRALRLGPARRRRGDGSRDQSSPPG